MSKICTFLLTMGFSFSLHAATVCNYTYNPDKSINIVEVTRGNGAPFIVGIDTCNKVNTDICDNGVIVSHTIGTLKYHSNDGKLRTCTGIVGGFPK